MGSEQQKNENGKPRRSRLSTRRLLIIGGAVLIVVVIIGYALSQISITPFSAEPTTIFDFDNGSPLLAEFQNTPLNQTSNNITAYFSSPSDTIAPAFSIQSYDTTSFRLSQFSGKYLYDNKPSSDILEIKFSQQLKSISLTFATVEYHVAPTNITLTAYMNSADTTPVGSTTTRGTFLTDIYPQGLLSFDSRDQPFSLVRIEIPLQGSQGATNFFVDNITIKPVQQK